MWYDRSESARAFKTVTDEALRLEVFRPNSLTKPDNDHPLCNMRKVQKGAVFFYGTGEKTETTGPAS